MIHDPYETCPFDESHRILRSRLTFHLTRCSKNHPNAKKSQCPYDKRHLIEPSDFQHHLETCIGRESVIHYALHDAEEEAKLNLVPMPTSDSTVVQIPMVENWDNDPEVVTYNPLKNIEKKPIVRTLIGASKSQKKKFREDERRRIQQLENEQERKEKQKREQERAAVAAALAQKRNLAAKSEHLEKETILRRPKKQSENLNRSLAEYKENNVEGKQGKAQADNSFVEPTVAGEFISSQSNETKGSKFTLTPNHGAISKRTAISNAEKYQNGTINSVSLQKQDSKTEPPSKQVPFSYAAALSKNVAAQKEKPNLSLNNSYVSGADTSIVDKLAQDIDELLLPCDEQDTSELDLTISQYKSRDHNTSGFNTSK